MGREELARMLAGVPQETAVAVLRLALAEPGKLC